MPCLTWWCAEPAWWPGMKLGSASAESMKYSSASATSAMPTTMAMGIRAGRLVMWRPPDSGDEEDREAQSPHDRAVDGERRQPVRFEEAHEEAHGQVRGDGGGKRADERGPADAVALRAGELG